MSQHPDLIESTQRLLDRAIKEYGHNSHAAEMLRYRLEQLKHPISAQATYLEMGR